MSRFSRSIYCVALGAAVGVVMMASTVLKAQEVSPERLSAARAAISALELTDGFDTILLNAMNQLTDQLIQAYPNLEEEILSTVEEEALKLAPRRADLEREAARIYAEAFSEEDLKAIAAFYNSQAGQNLINEGGAANREVFKAADIWNKGVARDLETNVNQALLKKQGGAVDGNSDGQ